MLDFNIPWLEENDTLVCFGDSLTASDAYVQILRQKLEKQKIKIINSGLGGDKTPAALTRLNKDVLDYKPDAVCVFLGTNDAAVGRGEWAGEPVVPPKVYKYNLIWIIHICKLAGIKKFSIATPTWSFTGNAFYKNGNILSSYCQMAREAADYTKARLVPLDAAFANELAKRPGKISLLHSPDGVHMSKEGNALIAETMLKAWGTLKN
jgi:acyl-CoA thioesterase I